MAKTKLKLGTRRSALAWAQSSWVAREIERANPDIEIELIGIETQGDRILDIPLRQVEGKEFFTAEIDRALLKGEVQLTVHSLKDLSLDRPQGLRLAAIPKRANPRDVILFGPRTEDKLAKAQSLSLGTSAPRRLENLPAFLRRALPNSRGATLKWVEIRGNVDTRLRRLLEPETSERFLDGVVLSLAGLTRLWIDHEKFSSGHAKLQELLKDLRWMVMPLSHCPSAPGQGALAIECREEDGVAFDAIRKLHDENTFQQVRDERAVLGELGGGCHQRFGATSVSIPGCGSVLFVKGRSSDGRVLDELRWPEAPESPKIEVRSWDGTIEKSFELSPTETAESLRGRARSGAVFLAHSHALPEGANFSGFRVWTSGTQSWFKLAEKGIWVEGCAEGLGYDSVRPLLQEGVLQLPRLEDWMILTHRGGEDTWKSGNIVSTYSLVPRADVGKTIPNLLTHVFWSSGSQFRLLRAQMPPGVHHSCGSGKTANLLRESGVKNFTVFPSVKEWRKWLKIQNEE